MTAEVRFWANSLESKRELSGASHLLRASAFRVLVSWDAEMVGPFFGALLGKALTNTHGSMK